MSAGLLPMPDASLLFVLGMHRSGTSAFAGFLSVLGFAAGTELLPPNPNNPKGHFESRQVVQLNERLLSALNRSWLDERPPNPSHLDEDTRRWVAMEAARIVHEEFGGSRRLVLKDPRLCRLLPVWREAAQALAIDARALIVLRNPDEVAASLNRRSGTHPRKAALLYAAYLIDAERHSRGLPRLVVEYGELLRDWRAVYRQLADELGLEFEPIEDPRALQVDTFLSPDLMHHEQPATSALLPDEAPAVLAHEVWQTLRSATKHELPKRMNRLRRRLKACLSDLEPWLDDAARGARLERDLRGPARLAYQAASGQAHSVLCWSTVDAPELAPSRAISARWRFGSDVNRVRFVLPPQAPAIQRLGWRITDRPALCHLLAIEVRDAQDALVWRWTPGAAEPVGATRQVLPLGVSAQASQDEAPAWTLAVLGAEPQLELELPAAVRSALRPGWSVVAEFVAELLEAAAGGIAAVLETLEQRITTLQVAQRALDTELRALRSGSAPASAGAGS